MRNIIEGIVTAQYLIPEEGRAREASLVVQWKKNYFSSTYPDGRFNIQSLFHSMSMTQCKSDQISIHFLKFFYFVKVTLDSKIKGVGIGK